MKAQYNTVLSLVALLSPMTLTAQTLLANPFGKLGSLGDLIELLLTILQMIAFPVMTIAVIYAGFLFVVHGNEEGEVTKAKAIILWTLVGVFIIVSAHVIAALINNTVRDIFP